MKIAIVSPANNVHTMRWANAMAGRGHSVTVFSCADHAPNKNVVYSAEVKIITLRFSAPLGYYLNAGSLKKHIKKGGFDVINVHYASGYGTLARRAKLKDALLNVWGSDVYEFPYYSAFNMRTLKKNLNYFKKLASTSYCMARQTKTLVNREFEITPFGVDTKLFKPMAGYKDNSRFVFGTVKTLSPKYGVTDSINAFIKVYNRLIDEGKAELASKLYYEIYGKGEQKEELQKLIDENGMSDRITLRGFIENSKLPQIYNGFDVAVYASITNSESFGVAAVEAMACGVPVCATDADGFVEVIEDGKCGFISPKCDSDALANNMYTLLLDENLRTQMGAAGVERVTRLYDWNDNVDIMEGIYNSLK